MKNFQFKVLLLSNLFFVWYIPIFSKEVVRDSTRLVRKGAYLLESKTNLVNALPALNSDKSVNVLVEIPAGTSGKWEVSKKTGHLEWEFRNNMPRIVQYLPYVANYGIIPQTLSPKSEGGDGDPLDVLLLGEAVPRGEFVKARLIGIMLTVDGGEIDDKVLAVAEGSVFENISSLSDLKKQFPGTIEIIKLWFENYKGTTGKIKVKGFKNEQEAYRILDSAIKGYTKYNNL